MVQRIRYIKGSKKGIWKSRSSLRSSTTGAHYYITIDMNEGMFKVINAGNRRIVRDGFSQNSHVLKRKAKEELLRLGVEFGEAEVRDNTGRIPGKNCAYQPNSREMHVTKEENEKTDCLS